MVPADSDKIPRVSSYSGSHWVTSQFRVQDLHLLRLAFQCHSTIVLCTVSWSYNPSLAGLGFSPFARRYLGNHSYFLFLQVLRCFNSLGFLIRIYGFLRCSTILLVLGSPIRISPDLCVLTTPRGVSPFAASFVVS